MLPNFLIAGGVATGTSFLSATLSQHPNIYLPRIQRPEPNFFHYSWKFNRGLEWYVQTWFSEVGDQKAIGERSSLMLPSDVAAPRIREALPNVRLIFCLRNPIERAWGNYRFTVLEGLEPLTFEEALDREDERARTAKGIWAEVQPHAYVTRSRYARNLQEYIDLFGREQILLLKSEELGGMPHETLARVCSFLGVDPGFKFQLPPNYSSPSVRDRNLQMKLREHFAERFADLVECVRREQDVSTMLSNETDRKNAGLLKANLVGGKDPLRDATRRRLQSLFAEEIRSIGDIVDFPVHDWV